MHLQNTDAPEIFIQRSDKTIQMYIERAPAVTIQDAIDWMNKVALLQKNNESINWVIVPKGETKLIGTICLWNIDKEKHVAEVGYSLHPNYFGKGIMNEALDRVVRYGFDVMNVERIDAFTHKNNKASLKLLAKNNFSRNYAFEEVYEDKAELEYNQIHTLLKPSA